MATKAVLSVFLPLALIVAVHAEDKKSQSENTRFEQFKQLAGEWVGKFPEGEKGPKEMLINYKVTSGGSAVVETITPGTDHEMITVIHPDGDNLILTHYCMLGNQPQMKAPAKGDAKVVPFEFVHATNLKSPKAMYMHDVKYTFVDKDNIKTEWTHYKDGKPAGKAVFELQRKK